jgi:hypothetical protein
MNIKRWGGDLTARFTGKDLMLFPENKKSRKFLFFNFLVSFFQDLSLSEDTLL